MIHNPTRVFGASTFLIFICAVPIYGQSLHKWKDEKGQWHITDTPPASPPSSKERPSDFEKQSKSTGESKGKDGWSPTREQKLDYQRLIVGKWLDKYETDYIEFLPGGALQITSKLADVGTRGNGRYRFVAEKLIEVQLPNAPNAPENKTRMWDIDMAGKDWLIIKWPSKENILGFEISQWKRVR